MAEGHHVCGSSSSWMQFEGAQGRHGASLPDYRDHRHVKIQVSGFDFGSEGRVKTVCKEGLLQEAMYVVDAMEYRDAHRHVKNHVSGFGFESEGRVKTLCKEGLLQEAMDVVDAMEYRGAHVSLETYACLLQACSTMKALVVGKQAHAHILRRNDLRQHIFLANTLINMYHKCGSLLDASCVFDGMPKRNVFTWTIMISGYVYHGYALQALELFWQMEQEGIKPDRVTFGTILKACASLADLTKGQQIHAYIIRNGFDSDVFVGSALVDMYAKCGSMEHAREVFERMPKRNVVSWSALIAGYAQHGHPEEALKLFHQMQQEGIKPNEVTLANLVKVCGGLADLELGLKLHDCIIKDGFESDVFIGSSLIDMYAKCGSIEQAQQVFDRMHKRSVVSWSAMIAGYAQHGYDAEAIELFWKMDEEGMRPNEVTFVSVLHACSSTAALEQGKKIHNYIVENRYQSNIFIGNSLVDMYAKCGSIENARMVFEQMPERNLVSWSTMIAGSAHYGHGKEALQLGERMQQERVKLDIVSFGSILTACSHAGLVDEALCYFNSAGSAHCIIPTDEHYACMVGILGRAGHLEEAEYLVKNMPFQPSATIWNSLLGACRIQGNMDLAKVAAEQILKLEPQNSGAFVLLSNIYAAAGKWDEKEDVRTKMFGAHNSLMIMNQIH